MVRSYFPQLVTHLSTYNLIYYLVNHGSTVIRTHHYKFRIFKYWFNDDGSLGFKIIQFKIDFRNLTKPETSNCEQTMPIISLVHCYQLGNQEFDKSSFNGTKKQQQHQ
ncbi:hypothetical protein ACTFIU_001537 [Dictyostelium citrinum]